MPEQLPQWNAVGVEPPASLKSLGWQPGMKPSAQHMNWLFNRSYKCIEELQLSGSNVTELAQTVTTLEQTVTTNKQEVTQHKEDDAIHVTQADKDKWNASDNAKFKSGSSTFTDNDTSQTFIDAFCTANSLVTVVITSEINPQGVWNVASADGNFTITSTVAEFADITFDYFIQKAVG